MWISVNISMTADGKAGLPGKNQLDRMGNDADKRRMKRLREEADAIVVGSKTIEYDNVALGLEKDLRRYVGDLVYPLRIAVFGGDTFPSIDKNIFDSTKGGTTLIACGQFQAEVIKKRYKRIPVIECGEQNRIDVEKLVERLSGEYSVEHLLIEGGPSIIGSFLKKDLIDRYNITVCPYLFGGERNANLSPIEGWFANSKDERRFTIVDFAKSDDWIFITYDRKR
jgi:riboflavin biosynthesis pyrimidine reductase